MGTLRQVLDGLVGQLAPLYVGATPPVQLAVGWPPMAALQDVSKGVATLGTVFDGDGTRDTTRWAGQTMAVPDVVVAPLVTAVLSAPIITPGGTATITLGGAIQANDAVVFSGSVGLGLGGAVLANATASASDTLNTLASSLAAAITSAGGGFSATATGAVVTVTLAATAPGNGQLGVNVGNLGTRIRELRRVTRHVRVIFWTQTEAIRQAVTDPADELFGELANFGFYTLPSGEYVHVSYLSDSYVDDEQLRDIYRRDHRLALEYGTTRVESLYPVLGSNLAFIPDST